VPAAVVVAGGGEGRSGLKIGGLAAAGFGVIAIAAVAANSARVFILGLLRRLPGLPGAR